MAFLYGIEITAATVYLPPRGPTFPHARHLSEMLLQGISEEIVCGRQGPRIILGDFNCQAGELEAMRFWSSCGFVELQDWFSRVHGFVPRHTCKSATTPDQIWISAELLPYVSNVGTWSIFPDHDMLVLGLSLSCPPAFEYQWRLPGRIPWDKMDLDRWHANSTSTSVKDLFLSVQAQSLDFDDTKSLAYQSTSLSKSGVPASRPSVVGSSLESTDSQGTTSPNDFVISDDNPTQAWISEAFARWSSNFEEQVSQSFGPTVTAHDRSFHGRGQLLQPSRRRVVPVVPRHSRQGEEVQACGFLTGRCAVGISRSDDCRVIVMQLIPHVLRKPFHHGLPCGSLFVGPLDLSMDFALGGLLDWFSIKGHLWPYLNILQTRNASI